MSASARQSLPAFALVGRRLGARAPPRRHSITTRCARNMASLLLLLHLLCILGSGVLAEPAPGRVPKVYNALITSNQNLEPSKAYPVYQPVLHDTAFAYPFQPVFYGGDFPINNGIFSSPGLLPKDPNVKQPKPSPPAETPTETKTPSTNPPPPKDPAPESDTGKATPAPPPPPNTQSPIPLNEFGLPAQVLPLGRIDPAFNGFTQVGPFSYSYPGLRFYDPYDPFSFSPYANFPPLYRPLPNVLSQSPIPSFAGKEAGPGPANQPASSESSEQSSSAQSPPPEPSDLNVLNYSSKDPAIPNVPPPPLPQGGQKSDDSSE